MKSPPDSRISVPPPGWREWAGRIWFEIKSIFIDYPGKPPWRQIVDTVLSAFLLALLIRWLFLQAFYIPSSSMENTLLKDDRILVSKVQYYFREPRHREIIVFWFAPEEKHFIKRVIGLPGDRIEMVRKKLYVNNVLQEEPYAVHKDPLFDSDRDDFRPIVVPKDHYLALGDNRDFSKDSRYWGFVDRKDIVGKAFCIYWPINRMGSLP